MTESLAEKIKSLHDAQLEDTAAPAQDSSVSGESRSSTASPSLNGNGQTKAGIPIAELLALGKLPSLPRKASTPRSNGASASPAPQKVPSKAAGSMEQTTTARLELPAIDKQQAPKSIAEIRKLGVSIEISKGFSGVTTVLLKGPVSAVEKARQLVERQLAPRVTVKLAIPASTRSTVIGLRGSTLKNITASTDTKINVDNISQPRDGWSLPLVTVEITGSYTGVQEAERMISDLVSASSLMDEREIPENLRLFVEKYLADRELEAASLESSLRLSAKFAELQAVQQELDDYLAQCAAEYAFQEVENLAIPVTLPPDLVFEDHSVAIVDGKLYGPAQQLDAAAEALAGYLAAMELVELDISKAHSRDIEHAARLAEFLELSGVIAELEAAHNVRVTRPEDELVYRISGLDKAKLQEVKRALVQAVNQRAPASLTSLDGIESEFGRSQAQRLAESLTRGSKNSVLAYTTDDGRVLMGYDFAAVDEDDFGPSPEQIAAALAEALTSFDAIVEREATLVTKSVPMIKSDYNHLVSPVGSAKQRLKSLLGEGKLPKVDFSYVQSSVQITGAESDVDAVVRLLPGIVAESKREFELSNYTQSVQFDSKLLKNLVGRNGSSISKIRDTYKCKIDANSDGEVVVRGREENVREAIKHIVSVEKELKNHRVEELTIPRRYHAILIGSKGRFVRRMQEKYNVHVKFPARYDTPSGGSGSDDGTASAASSEQQGTDVVVLSGPSQGVAATKKEFEDLVAYEKSHSFSREVDFAVEHLPRLIGRKGAFINQLSAAHSVHIDIKRDDSTAKLVITGAKPDVEAAIVEIKAEAARLSDYVEKVLVVDNKYHRYLTGPANSIRNKIVEEAGGDPENASRILHIPTSASGSKDVRISGPSKVVEAIAAKVQAIVDQEQARNKFKTSLSVPTSELRYVIGPGGAAKREIESEFGVTIDIPNSKAASANVSIRGRNEEDIEGAKERVLSLVNLGRLEVMIPAYLEGDIFNRGQLAQDIESKYGVRLSTPKRPSNPRAVPKPPSGEATASAAHFATAPFNSTADSDKNVTWTLSGKDEESCKRASEAVQSAIDKHAKHDTTGYLWFPPQTAFSKIIGPGGNSINEVRNKSGCQIVVPKQGRGADPVTIRGSSEDVEQARQLLLALADLAE